MTTQQPEFTQDQKVKAFAGTVIFFIAIGLFIWIFLVPSCDKESSIPKKKEFSNFDALYDSQQFVKKKLKAPSTAEFPYEAQSTIMKENDTTFTIISYVDSQNGFGAMLRSNYSCKILYSSDNMVHCTNLIIE